METLEKANKIMNHNTMDLVNGVKNATATIKMNSIYRGWRFTGSNFNENTLLALVAQLCVSQRKVLKNKINACNGKKTMQAYNKFLHFLTRKVYLDTVNPAPCVKLSEKEEKIQKARKNYVEARDLTISCYKTYKDEKGDFYKIK